MKVWIIDETDDGRIELTAPNGLILFTVSKETAELVGRMLLDVAEDEEETDGE